MSRQHQAIDDFVEAIAELAKVNRLTGIWDNRRFQECKKPLSEVDIELVYKSEKLGRLAVELRAEHRTQIDVMYERIIEPLR